MQPPPPMPTAVPGKDRTNLFGWLGVVVGLCCCGVLGIIFGVLSVQNAKRFGQSPTLGYVAIVLSAVNILTSGILGATGHYPYMNR
jgi:hypothetical protein